MSVFSYPRAIEKNVQQKTPGFLQIQNAMGTLSRVMSISSQVAAGFLPHAGHDPIARWVRREIFHCSGENGGFPKRWQGKTVVKVTLKKNNGGFLGHKTLCRCDVLVCMY